MIMKSLFQYVAFMNLFSHIVTEILDSVDGPGLSREELGVPK